MFFNHLLWDDLLLFGLLGTGLMFTWRLGFLQLFKLPKVIGSLCYQMSHRGQHHTQGISSLQALATAIAAQVGTGNLAGAATAIVSGGPGAIFWMWLSAFFGMATIYAESILAQVYRIQVDNSLQGGPAYYIRDGLKRPQLAVFFAICTIIALGCVGNMVQANSISHAFHQAFSVPFIVSGTLIAILLLCVVHGGINRIATVCEVLVPSMALCYLLGCIIILWLRAPWIVPAFKSIFSAAFSTHAVGGGIIGISIQQAMRYGVSRGLFSNEAGMGSTPHAHAAADVKHPTEQGEIAIFSVFFDTFIVLTLTALVILTSSTYLHMMEQPPAQWVTSIELTQSAFNDALPYWGEKLIAISLLFFAFSTILGWYYFAEINIRFLFNQKHIKPFQWIVAVFVFSGTLLKVDLIWELADTFNGLMCLPNLIALWGLQQTVIRIANSKDINANTQ